MRHFIQTLHIGHSRNEKNPEGANDVIGIFHCPRCQLKLLLISGKVSLRKEKKTLEKELYGAELKSRAYSMLIDMAESRYHIRIRKNSDAK